MHKLTMNTWLALLLAFGLAVTGCRKTNSGVADATADGAKKAIATQLDLLKAGKTEELKGHFTPRLRDRITSEAVEKGKQETSKYTLDDLVGSVDIQEREGTKAAKIKMKNGRSLTTLVWTDGNWLADTVWFQ